MHILPMKSLYQTSVKKLRWLTGRFQIWVIDPRCGSFFADGSQSCWWKMLHPLKGCLSPGESGCTCGVGEAKDEDEGVQCNYFWKQIAIHEDIVEKPWKRKSLLTDFILFFSYLKRQCISMYFRFSMRDSRCFACSKFMWVQAEPRRSVYKPVGIRPVTKPEVHWYAWSAWCALVCDVWQGHVIKTCPANPEMQEIQDEFEDVLVEEPEDVPEANHCTPYCRCWYHFGLMLMLFRPGGITWITGRHRRALWRGMAFGCHHDIMYTLSTHIDTPWHDSRVLMGWNNLRQCYL